MAKVHKAIKHLVDENGGFKTEFKKHELGYWNDCILWLYYHNNLSFEDKLKLIKVCEETIEVNLKKHFPKGTVMTDKMSDKLIAKRKKSQKVIVK